MPKKDAKEAEDKKTQPGLRARAWVDGPEGTFFGHGRAVLLERIIEHGSITKAAKSMNMAYRHAWDLVDSMNRQAKEPFVVVATGGKGGGGAQVTPAGKKTLKMFRQFHKELETFMKQRKKKFTFSIKKEYQ